MKKNLIYILSLAVLFLLYSCGLEEVNVPEPDTSDGSTIEFIARPTYYDEFNISTKVTSNQINDLENKIYTAFFMLYDNDGNRVIFKDLTITATENNGTISYSVPTQELVSDKGLINATACFIANVSTDYAKSLRTVADLKGEKPLNIEYASITSECVGIPLLTDDFRNLDKVYSIPMAGVYEGDMSALGDSNNSIQIPLERLFAKIVVELGIYIPDENTTDNNVPQFTLSNFVVNNMPNKVAIMAPDNDPPATLWAASANAADYLVTDNWMSNFNLDNGADDSETVTTGQGAKSLFFYVPEHMVPRDRDNTMADNEELRQQQKPLLVDSDKKPIYVSLKGNLNVPGSSPMIADYNIYLGENSWDDFNIKRNRIYTNNITINGAEADNRVEFTHGDVSVLFKRATYLDSHFEVRPLRVKWTGEGSANGTVTVKVMHAYDDEAEAPNWVRLERPAASDRNNTNTYCGTIGKRKYFTTDLVNNTLRNNISLNFPISEDADGDFPTWVYVDEYIMPEDANSFTDAVRQARIRVIFSPADATRDVLTVDYVITQRSVYPVVATYQEVKNALGVSTGKYTYGIEYFEEYLYDYDRVDIEDLGDGEYHASQNGIEWGLDGVQLSHLHRAAYIDHVNEVTLSTGQDLVDGIINGLVSNIDGTIETMMTSQMNRDDIYSPYYDFYLPRDGANSSIESREYAGPEFNSEIINYLKTAYSSSSNPLYRDESIQLDGISLDDNAKSVIAYCYNKNKRNSSGAVDVVHWYAPAIDEIEDITYSAASDFDVFYENLYWSCQPSFEKNKVALNYQLYVNFSDPRKALFILDADGIIDAIGSSTGTGFYQTDNLLRARATSAIIEGGNVDSGVSDGDISNILNIYGDEKYYYDATYTKRTFGGSTYYTFKEFIQNDSKSDSKWNTDGPVPTGIQIDYDSHPGNLPRTGVKKRVRCVYSKEGIAL